MTTPEMNWTRWPHPSATAEPHLDDGVEKQAEQEYGSYSLEDILQGVAAELPGLEAELPSGIDKTAAMRFGTSEPLPDVTMKNIWRHPNAHPLVLLMLVIERFGKESMEWEPETLRITLRKNDILLSESTWTKLLAGRVILQSPSPWRQWEQFHWISYGLAGRAPNFVYLERPEIGFLMSAVDQMKMVDRGRPLAEDIDKFVAAVLRESGIAYAPIPLAFAQEELNDRHLRCKDCGTHEKDDLDIKCIACGSKNLTKVDGVYEVLRDKTKTLFEVRKRMPIEQAVEGLGNSAADNACYRLLIHSEYRNQIRAQLLGQLRMLRKGT